MLAIWLVAKTTLFPTPWGAARLVLAWRWLMLLGRLGDVECRHREPSWTCSQEQGRLRDCYPQCHYGKGRLQMECCKSLTDPLSRIHWKVQRCSRRRLRSGLSVS